MARNNPRDYRVSDGDLIQLADSIKIFAVRDAAEFAGRMVGPDEVAALAVAREAFADTLSDTAYFGMCVAAQDDIEKLRREAADQVRVVHSIAGLGLGSDGRFAAFGFGKMPRMTDEAYHRALRRVCRVGARFLSVLAPHGLTQAMLDALSAKADAIDEALEAYAERLEDRLIATAGRVALGNALFAHVSRFSVIGQSLFFSTDEARYIDYLLPS